MTRHHSCRVSPFGHPRINARLAAPRGLSQPPTSFIGSQCQGIHHAPLNTYKHKTNIRNCTSENNHHTPPTPSRERKPAAHGCCSLDARNHYPRIKHHTPHHQRRGDNNPPPTGGTITPGSPEQQGPKKGPAVTGLLSQSPIVCLMINFSPAGANTNPRIQGNVCCAPEPAPTTGPAHPSNRLKSAPPQSAGRLRSRGAP